MANSHLDNERKKAWMAAKEAVRAYARNPTVSAAERVEACWRAIRNQNSGGRECADDPLSLLEYRPRQNPTLRLAGRDGKATTTSPQTDEASQQSWPVNDIVMRSLLRKGMRDAEIAAIYHVSKEVVRQRRESLEV